jgi:hypothetical protein
MLNTVAIRDLRKNLNEAQDFGQEALVWIRRAEKIGDKKFDDDAYYNARAAFHRAKFFVDLTGQVSKELEQ